MHKHVFHLYDKYIYSLVLKIVNNSVTVSFIYLLKLLNIGFIPAWGIILKKESEVQPECFLANGKIVEGHKTNVNMIIL
jgi:hypothetical protein